ncbi:MAG: L-lactate permease, partial [Gammaproteobacteria bacterium]
APAAALVVLLAALLCRRGALGGSAIGIAAVLAVIYFDRRYALDARAFIKEDLRVVGILTLSAALVIIPGQIFNALLQSANIISGIGAQVRAFAVPRVKMAAVIVLGLAPALESLTGFGVSLFVTVPLLMQLFPLRRALLLSLLGMNIMPWGTLALATLIGAQIAGLPFAQLSMMTAVTSFAVFPLIGVLVGVICRADREARFDLLYPPLAGLILACALVIATRYAAAELAGVFAGLSVALLLLGASARRAWPHYAAAPLLRLLAPYLLLITLIGLSRIPALRDVLQSGLRVEGGGVEWVVFTSPGVFILLSALAFCAFSQNLRARRESFQLGLKRALYPIGGIMLFVLFAQLHRAGGLFTDIAARMVRLQPSEAAFAVPLLGMLSGYATGSNVGGNALFMSLQSESGAHFARQLAFAAMQNSAAGHAVFLSLPVILLTLSIAGAEARAQQTWLMRRALLCAPPVYASLTLPFYFMTG